MLDEELPNVCNWFQANKLSLNTDKTFCQLYSNSRATIDINSVKLKGARIKQVDTVKYLGVLIDRELKWTDHVIHISSIISRNIGILKRSRHFLTSHHRYLLYNSLILPYLNYCCLLWGMATKTLLNKLLVLQKRAARFVDNQPRLAHSSPIFVKYKMLKLGDIARQQIIVVMHNVITHNYPSSIISLFEIAQPNPRETRAVRHFTEIFSRKSYRTRTIAWLGPRLWNTMLAPNFPHITSVPASKRLIKQITKQLIIREYE